MSFSNNIVTKMSSHADGRESLRRRYDTIETVHPVRKQSVDADTDDDCQGIGHPEQQGEPQETTTRYMKIFAAIDSTIQQEIKYLNDL